MPKLELRDFRIDSMRLSVERDFQGDTVVAVEMAVPSVDDGRPTKVRSRATIDGHYMRDDHASDLLVRQAYDTLRSALLHELDEKFYVDGERYREPHPEGEER